MKKKRAAKKTKTTNALSSRRSTRKTVRIPTEGPPIPPVVRTADARFRNLPGYPFAPHYVEVGNPHAKGRLRMHYVDEGPASGDPKSAPSSS